MRHPEMKLEIELNRDVKRHQCEMSEAFAQARMEQEARWAMLRREFPVRTVSPMFRRYMDAGMSLMADLTRMDLSDPSHTHGGGD